MAQWELQKYMLGGFVHNGWRQMPIEMPAIVRDMEVRNLNPRSAVVVAEGDESSPRAMHDIFIVPAEGVEIPPLAGPRIPGSLRIVMNIAPPGEPVNEHAILFWCYSGNIDIIS